MREGAPPSNACNSEQFDIYEQNTFLAVSGFVDDDYFFYEGGREGLDGNGRNNLLSLLEVPYDGDSLTACLFACRGATIIVSCVAPGRQLCGETIYNLAG